jgi:hypothetical protein
MIGKTLTAEDLQPLLEAASASLEIRTLIGCQSWDSARVTIRKAGSRLAQELTHEEGSLYSFDCIVQHTSPNTSKRGFQLYHLQQLFLALPKR